MRASDPDRCEIRRIDEEMVHQAQAQMVDGLTATQLAEFFKALSDPTRVRIISALSAGELWSELFESLIAEDATWSPPLRRLLDAGTLATRIESLLPRAPTRADLRAVYAELADCLHEGRLFRAP